MSAAAMICDSTIDRAKESIIPSGVTTKNYQENPVVLFEHGMSGIVLPIATSADRDTRECSLSLVSTGDIGTEYLEATSWFVDLVPEAYQIFGLIAEDVIRATSIQVVPGHNAVMKYRFEDGREVDVTEHGDMVEWSWATIGVNPNALRKSWFASEDSRDQWLIAVHGQIESAERLLRTGTVGNSRLSLVLRKSLLSLVPKREPRTVGLDPKAGKNMKRKIGLSQLAKLSTAQLKAINANGEEYDEETIGFAEQLLAPPSEEDRLLVDEALMKAEVAEPEEEAKAVLEEIPLGARVIRDFHEMLQAVIDGALSSVKPVENEIVRGAIEAEIAAIMECQATLAGAYAEAYPELPTMPVAPATESEESEVVSQLKAMIGGDRRRGFQFAGLRSRISQIAGGKNLSDAQKKSLSATVDDMDRLFDAARTFRQPANELKAVQDQVTVLEGKLSKLLANYEPK